MRLVSVYYQEFHPFDMFPIFKSFVCLNDPNDLKPGDVIVVWGGADIHPSLYKKNKSVMSGAWDEPSKRDIVEWNMMQAAKELGIPIIGVCRGAQMLCGLAGGYLYQHVNGHGGNHQVKVKNMDPGYTVNSLHHQMMVPGPAKHELIAWTENRSNVYWDEDRSIMRGEDDAPEVEPEFVYFPDVQGFAIQWHPEMMAANAPATLHIKQFITERLSHG